VTISSGAVMDLSGWDLTVITSLFNQGKIRLMCRENVTVQTWTLAGTWEYVGLSSSGAPVVCPLQSAIPADNVSLNPAGLNKLTRFALLHDLSISGRLDVLGGILDLAGYNVHAKSLLNAGIIRMVGNETVDAKQLNDDTSKNGSWLIAGLSSAQGNTITLHTRSFHNLLVNESGAQDTFLMSEGTTVQGSLEVRSGTLAVGDFVPLKMDSLLISGGNLQANGMVTINGTANVRKGTYAMGGRGSQTLNDLTVEGGIVKADAFSGAFQVQGTLKVSSGSFVAPALLSVSRDVIVNAKRATFDPRFGTVVLDGTKQTIAGSVTFNNLTKLVTKDASLIFSGATVTTKGTLSLVANRGAVLSLRSKTFGKQWLLYAGWKTNLSGLNVQDSLGNDAKKLLCKGCKDAGNNVHWTFQK
jgi:hypothetical protein